MDCLFCRINAGEIPSTKIYEDELVYAFADINPQAPYHAVFIPKEHIGSAAEINTDNSAVIARIFEAIARVARRDGLADGFRVVTNCGESAGQSVPHLHFHLLAGREFGWPPG